MNDLGWRFAGFEYSPHTGLRRGGVQIPVGPQARQLLELLLEAKGGVVSKAEIGARLWPGRPPSDDSIDRCAYLLRKPLREAGYGDLIATAYGRGLSLRAKVEVVDSDLETARPPEECLSSRTLDLWQATYELAGNCTRDGFERAQEAVAAAAQRDETSPAVWSLSAIIAASRVSAGYLRPAEAAEIIEKDAGRALVLAPGFPAALAVLGWARATLLARPADGLAMLDRAVARDPRYGRARAFRSWAFVSLDRLTDAIDEIEAGLHVSPHDRAHLNMRAWLELCNGNLDGSATLADQGLRTRPDATYLTSVLAIVASLSGRHQEAERTARDALMLSPGHPILMAVLAYVLAVAGDRSAAEATLAAAHDGEQVAPPHLFTAAAQLALGKPDDAAQTLRRGRDEGCPWFAFAPYDPRLAALQEDIGRLRAERNSFAG
ncbi:winged helix-turn-helix domain-containing protein [Methylocystis echinoides]|jgi:DNA-binding winged helix-turn-helix (wHTH) protein/Flp pilus assembly protein TadD|uniref:winged helix-turn-helix domain-containing protein n=1 Tax=Methylocystis echinoides TaxID=29468 RepID=UPI00344A6A1D